MNLGMQFVNCKALKHILESKELLKDVLNECKSIK